MDRAVRVASAVLLLIVLVGAMLSEKENIADYFADAFRTAWMQLMRDGS